VTREGIEQFFKNLVSALGHCIFEDAEVLGVVIPALVCVGVLWLIGVAVYDFFLDPHVTTDAALDAVSIDPNKVVSALIRERHRPLNERNFLSSTVMICKGVRAIRCRRERHRIMMQRAPTKIDYYESSEIVDEHDSFLPLINLEEDERASVA
jgi:hypothetical protein